MENLNNTNSSSGRGNNNLLKENILINVFLGIICIFIIIGLIIIIKIRFCKKKSYDVNNINNNKDNLQINNNDSVQRIPNPLYRIDSISYNKLYTTIDEEIISVRI
jgi:cell division protein YceG involved in septum cleavage